MPERIKPENLDADATLIKLRARLEMLADSDPTLNQVVVETYIQLNTLISVCQAQQLEIKKLKAFK